MSQNDYRDELRDAITLAKSSARCTVPAILQEQGTEITGAGAGKRYARICPCCGGRQKMIISEDSFRCFKSSCPANSGGDTIGLISILHGCDNRQAVRTLLSRAGIEHPYDRFMREKNGGEGRA
jgi:hypothetical protein